MGRRRVRRGIYGISLIITIVSLATYVMSVVHHQSDPFWNAMLLIYSVVFWVFLAFDLAGRELVAHSQQRKANQPAPRPRPMPSDGGPVVAPSAADGPPEVRLRRAKAADASLLEEWVSRCLAELAALEPQGVESGGAQQASALVDDGLTQARGPLDGESQPAQPYADAGADDWLDDQHAFVFFIEADRRTEGICVARRAEADALGTVGETQLSLLYVSHGKRRVGVASQALSQLLDFLELLGNSAPLEAVVSAHNVRAMRFLQKNGWSREEGAGNRSSSDPVLMRSPAHVGK